ncbi:hypothetical protein [Micromonospora sonchi]|nr:hypothetical protein [Micromonospora sonchi]
MNDGGPLESLDRWVRRGPGRFLLLVIALTVAGTAVILAAGLVASGIDSHDPRFISGDPPDWASALGILLFGTGLATTTGGFLWLGHSGHYRRNARSRLWAKGWSRRRALVRQVRGTALRRDEDRPLLPLVAEHLIDQPAFALPLGGMAMLQVAQAFLRWAPGFVILAVVFVGVLGVVTVTALRNARSARAFLAEHAAGEA